jgi:hypothetical protein
MSWWIKAGLAGALLSFYIAAQDHLSPLSFTDHVICILLLITGLGLFIDAKRDYEVH